MSRPKKQTVGRHSAGFIVREAWRHEKDDYVKRAPASEQWLRRLRRVPPSFNKGRTLYSGVRKGDEVLFMLCPGEPGKVIGYAAFSDDVLYVQLNDGQVMPWHACLLFILNKVREYV